MKRRMISLFLAAAVWGMSMTAPAFALDTEGWQKSCGQKEAAWEESQQGSSWQEEAGSDMPEREESRKETIQQETMQQEEVQNPDTWGDLEMPDAEEKYHVSVETEHGQIVFLNNRTTYCAGEAVDFSIVPEENYRISEVTALGGEGNPEILLLGEGQYRFFMPVGNVSIKAVLLFNEHGIDLPEDAYLTESENPKSGETEPAEGELYENFDLTLFNEESADLIQAESPETEELLEEIKSGEVLALAPIENRTLESAAMLSSTSGEGSINLAAETGSFTLKIGAYQNMDEIWVNNGAALDHFGTVYREIVYTDDEGVTRKAPVYCMNASKSGPLSPATIKEEAIKVLSNSSLKKILYYGYGGPGDICDSYDPTCSHCDWSKKENRYVLTHYALSKIYAGDVAKATAAECEHVGLDKWISKLTSFVVPNVKDVKFYGKDSNGDTVSAKDMAGNLTYYKVVPESLNWSGMKNGVQISGIYRLTSSLEKNGIRFTKKSTDTWVMGYWTSEADYTERGTKNPRILGAGKSVTLYKGARIRFAFPHTVTGNQKMNYTSIMKPVEYIAISSSVQLNQSDMQDLGTYYYEGEREKLSLTFRPSPSGTVILKKTADQDSNVNIQGAGYHLKAAQDIVSNGTVVLKKDEKAAGAYTNENGEITFSNVPVGKYYLVEVGAKEGTQAEKYQMDVTEHPVTVVKNTSSTVAVSEIPDMRGKVSVRKVIENTELNLEGAEFTLYSYSKSSRKYTNGVKLLYDQASKRYVSEVLSYTSDNQGKFVVEETKNPKGFTGTFRKEFVLTKLGEEELFEYTAENTVSPMRVEITKVDSVTREILSDAEFTIYEWDNLSQAYKSIGEPLTFQKEKGRYYSKELKITDLNMGRFKLAETRLPEGYTGSFEQEINLYDGNGELQFTAENTPIPPKTGNIRIKKTDSVKGEILSDAEFTVYQYNSASGKYENTLGEQAKLSFDEKSQLYVSGDLAITTGNAGKFKVVETKAPEGYKGSWEKEFVLTEENLTPAPFEAVNEPDRPPLTEITVIKKIKENEILWAHGNPVFSFVAEGKDEKGIRRKYENYVCFSPGGYTVDKDGYAVMQITFRNVPAGEYQIYEKPVLYYYLEASVANTSNVTIVKGSSPAYGIQPKSIAYGTARLTAAKNKASITFVNKKGRYDRYVHNDEVKNRIPVTFE